jgi:ferredoxin
MGHLGHLREEYRGLVERLEAGPVALPEPTDARAREGWREILEILFSPEDAALASCLPVFPSSVETIARRLSVTKEELEPRLESMANKGLVFDLVHPDSGEVRYLLAPPVIGFFEFSMMRAHDGVPKRRMAEALEAYTHGDDTFAREVFGSETVVGRAMVHETSLDEDQLPDVLEWERATSVVSDADPIAVSMCYCRHKAEHMDQRCDAPVEVCLSLNTGADFVIRRGFGRRIDSFEALDIMTSAREKRLIQIADNVMNRPAYVCNCCGCCCGQLQAINDFDLVAVNPSGFIAAVRSENCAGCTKCARACPVGAITMKPRRTAAKRKTGFLAEIDLHRCIGCGICAGACRKDAMTMRPREQRPHVPANSLERSLRMALEKGRLPHLLFDQGAGRGSRFLNQALQVLCRMPPAERVLASRQVHSRFVRYALGAVARSNPETTA